MVRFRDGHAMIPAEVGFMELNTYLHFDGTCDEAMTFYADILGGTIVSRLRFREMEDHSMVPEDRLDMVANMQLKIGDRTLMASDGMQPPKGGHSGYSLQLNLADLDEARRIFDALTRDGSQMMPFGPTFWARGFGMGSDRFGVDWMVNCD
ncbi:VOC family protein [Jannaschia sp. S6380]|uniref:VOC family protein n=1 Tax=Jannaschia sp. S6380 TaxID=2926408 RepID=UPI001FF2E5DE|nr:VOC family protein [Jannaschia sp. S6380]MCK0167637.1 VOC family protein [Jannaschia sp. S6380]